MYVPKKDVDEIVALIYWLKILTKDMLKFKIQRYLGILKLEGIRKIDHKMCVPIAGDSWNKLLVIL